MLDVLAELNELKVQYEYSGNENVKVLCPYHQDTNPSLAINLKTLQLNCFVCQVKTSFFSFYAKQTGGNVEDVQVYLAKKYKFEVLEGIIPEQIVDTQHFRILNAGPLIKALKDRAITLETIKEHKLGEEAGRITIPVYTETDRCVNILSYAPGATTNKFQTIKGRKSDRFYPIKELAKEKIVLAAGPVKALAVKEHLAKAGRSDIGALSATLGEGNWSEALTKQLIGKTVYIVYDVDRAGITAAKRVAGYLYKHCKAVHIINLEIDKEAYPKGGIDDWLFLGNELVPVLEQSLPLATPEKVKSKAAPISMSLGEAYFSENAGIPVTVEATVAGLSETPYNLPKVVAISCHRNADPKTLCTLCPVNLEDREQHLVEFDTSSRTFLGMVGKEDVRIRAAVKQEAGIPAKCSAHTQTVLEFVSVDELRISTKAAVNTVTGSLEHQPAFAVGTKVENNLSYSFTGQAYPHPDTQVATLVIEDAEAISASIDTWKLENPELMEDLRAGPTLEDVETKLDEVYKHMTYDITKIYGRQDMLMMYDLIYHSVLRIQPFGKVDRGWLEGLVIGDSSQGKSEIIDTLLNFYGVGEKVDCANTTIAGLIGGNEHSGVGGKHFVIWGTLPRNDRGFICLEEMAKFPSPAIFQACTECRSSGVARITKIANKSALARTRLAANSNTKSARLVSTYGYGLDTIVELIDSPADIRRFDFAMVISAASENPTPIPKPRPFADVVLRNAQMFAWTRTAEQVIFEDLEELKAASARLCSTYITDKCPLIDPGSQKLKLARIATAIAIKTWSVLDGEFVIVKAVHIQAAERFLDRIYSHKDMGYRKYSSDFKVKTSLRSEEAVSKLLAAVPFLEETLDGIRSRSILERKDIKDLTGYSIEECENFLGGLVRNRALDRKTGNGYVKTPAFVNYLDSTPLEDILTFRKSAGESKF